ncbi:glycosyltransferase [Chitinispirillales bacterium ANBcel5]|uniref:glycosyltransferase n=1 Tax=Cellulosispirillum alkaliphilum TaxID=3039283 RepID=UPI002A516A64|nr:glycosyltransferase [Chitinispirillales bacterium ANBcel5]
MGTTKKVLIWPDIRYEPGHWRPVMAIAEKLLNPSTYGIDDNFEVRFLCTPECERILDAHDPEWPRDVAFDGLYDIGYSSLEVERPHDAHSRMEHCRRIANGELDDIINDFQPDLILAGFFVSLEALLIHYKYDVPMMITTTFLRHPDEDPAITSLRFMAFHSPEESAWLMNAVTGGNEYNGSTDSIVQFIAPLEDVHELITCPQELDHPEFVHRSKTIYVEPCILDAEPATGSRKVFVTAGSRVRDYEDKARKLFDTTRELSAVYEKEFYFAVGYSLFGLYRPPIFFRRDSRIEVVRWANQTQVLQNSSVAVVHGGLATIKECIYYNVPMVIIPFGKDQMDNALRVVNVKVGIMKMLDNLTKESLQDAIINAETLTWTRRWRLSLHFKEMERQAPSVRKINEYLEEMAAVKA